MASKVIFPARNAPLHHRGRFDPVEPPAAGREKNQDAVDARQILASK
jgi:hypothetical protein